MFQHNSATDTVKILAIAGSLRRDSLNRAALRAAQEAAPPGTVVEEAEIGDIPLYNGDTQAAGFPEGVTRLGAQIADADAVLFVTPEYNYSIPGVLKNAIDWVSRLPDQPFAGKAAAVMGASPGNLGTARAQYHMRQVGVFVELRFLNKPEVMIGGAAEKFDAEGRLTDPDTGERIAALVGALADWARLLKAASRTFASSAA